MEEMNKEVVVVIVQNARLTDVAFSMQARARSIRGRVAQYGRCALCLTSGTVTRKVCALAFFFIPPLSLSLSLTHTHIPGDGRDEQGSGFGATHCKQNKLLFAVTRTRPSNSRSQLQANHRRR